MVVPEFVANRESFSGRFRNVAGIAIANYKPLTIPNNEHAIKLPASEMAMDQFNSLLMTDTGRTNRTYNAVFRSDILA